jgi:hypothetical protein
MSRLEGRWTDSLDDPVREAQRKNLKKAILEDLLAKKGLALYCQRKGAL